MAPRNKKKMVPPPFVDTSFTNASINNFKVALTETAFAPGGVVSGSLTFSILQPISFRCVSIKIIGKEKTHAHGYYSRINVHKEQVTLLGGLKGTEFKANLPPGEYNFPFAFALPANAPPTVPKVSSRNNIMDADLTWYVKASIDTPNHDSIVLNRTPASIAIFTVATAMPMSQYQTRAPFSSPPHRADRTCCCCSQGVTTAQTNLSQNMLVFGRDTSLDGNISIDNSESKEDTNNIVVSLHRVCWLRVDRMLVPVSGPAGNYPIESTVMELVGTTTIQSNMKAGDGEKRFNFSIPIPNTPNLGSCYLGHNIFYYYKVEATCDGNTLSTTNIVASNALDETNRSALIDIHTPGPIVPTKEYRKYVYAPPPGALPTYPIAASEVIPQPTGNVSYLKYGQPPPNRQAPLSVMHDDDI